MKSIYLDHNSTTPIDPSVADVLRECYATNYLNPASQHRLGQQARTKLEKLRTSIAEMLGAHTTGMSADHLIFTSGGTESNNLALIGMALQAKEQRLTIGQPVGQVLISAIEHPSVVGAAEQLTRLGFVVQKIAVDQSGVCQIDSLEQWIEQPTCLVSLMLANNETGVLQPVSAAAAICRENNILFHTDAVQSVAKMPVQFSELGVDALSFTAHKFNGPRGIGGLLLRHGVSVAPILFGGFQQTSIRPGTEDVALVAGMEAALKLFHENPDRLVPVSTLRDYLENLLITGVPESVIIGGQSPRLPQTLNISFRGIDRQSFLLAADMRGLAISTGSACASGSSELSPVLLAMDLPRDIIEGAIRISFGVSNTLQEVTETGRLIIEIVDRLRSSKATA